MDKDNGGPAFDQCWMVWFRDELVPDGRWYAVLWTHSHTRISAIAKAKNIWGWGAGTNKPNGWRNHRRRGLVKAVRTTLSTGSPLEIAAHFSEGAI